MNKMIDFHKDHKEWTSKLSFYKDEIVFFFKELNMVFDQNKVNLARMEFIDEYEAILDKKSEKIKNLEEKIQQGEKDLLDDDKKEKIAKEHHQLHLEVIEFEQSFDEMKKGFKRFASHND